MDALRALDAENAKNRAKNTVSEQEKEDIAHFFPILDGDMDRSEFYFFFLLFFLLFYRKMSFFADFLHWLLGFFCFFSPFLNDLTLIFKQKHTKNVSKWVKMGQNGSKMGQKWGKTIKNSQKHLKNPQKPSKTVKIGSKTLKMGKKRSKPLKNPSKTLKNTSKTLKNRRLMAYIPGCSSENDRIRYEIHVKSEIAAGNLEKTALFVLFFLLKIDF
jgi:hypothetical protein